MFLQFLIYLYTDLDRRRCACVLTIPYIPLYFDGKGGARVLTIPYIPLYLDVSQVNIPRRQLVAAIGSTWTLKCFICFGR